MNFIEFCDSPEKNRLSYTDLFSIAWQLVINNACSGGIQEKYDGEMFEIDTENVILKRTVSDFEPDPAYSLPFSQDGITRSGACYTAGILAAELFFGQIINIRLFQSDAEMYFNSDPHSSLFTKDDLNGGTCYAPPDFYEKLTDCIIDLTSFDEDIRTGGVNKFIDIGRGIGCEYVISVCAPDGSCETEFNIPVNYDSTAELMWPESEPPAVTLSDGRLYAVMPLSLPFVPGIRRKSLHANSVIENTEPTTENPVIFDPSTLTDPEPAEPVQRSTDPVDENAPINPELIAGIDLGTENTCVVNGNGSALSIDDDEEVIPSVLFFEGENTVEIGRIAENRGRVNSMACVRGFKRLIGSDQIVNGGIISVEGPEIQCSGQQASVRFLVKLLDILAQRYDSQLQKLVVTIPAKFTSLERTLTEDAVISAGFDRSDFRLVEEPVAAAMYYDCDKLEGKTAVFDLGGGTFDFSIIENGTVKAVNGDLKIGGTDFTEKLIGWFCDKCASENIELPSRDAAADFHQRNFYSTLYARAEDAKKNLSINDTAEININVNSDYISQALSYTVTRREFESLIADYLKTMRDIVTKTLDDCRYSASDIDRVIIVGGSTFIPCIDNLIRNELFPDCNTFFDNDRLCSVARGAAKCAAKLWGQKNGSIITARQQTDIGIETSGRRFSCIVPKGTEFTEEGTFITEKYYFTSNNKDRISINILSRADGVTTDVLPLFRNNDFKIIGKIEFSELNIPNLLDHVFVVRAGINRDGAFSCFGSITTRSGELIIEKPAVISII